jgi:hypothetical protein
VFTLSLPRKGLVYLPVSRSSHSNGSTQYIAPSLRPFVPNGLQAYRHFFFSEGCACDVCAWSHLPPHCSVCTMFTRQLLPLLLPQGRSRISCRPVKMYTTNLELVFHWILYATSLARVTTLYGTTHEEWSLGVFPFVRVGR